MKTVRWSGISERRFSDGQWTECTGNVVSQLHFLQRGASVEQQMKLPTADKAYVSDFDMFVVCRDGFPSGWDSDASDIIREGRRMAHYHSASLWRQRKSISL